ncbi:MAG: HD domain-containing protein [Rhodocyclaceae bacterium]|nr:HD domain-containing protein [Rhodocyclaceae bacterium]
MRATKATMHDEAYFRFLQRQTSALSVALGFRDEKTHRHSERVAEQAVALGARCGMAPRELAILRIAAAVHDIGKIGIPDNILSKQERLTAADWDSIRNHPVMGADILLACDFEGARELAEIVRHHHEAMDGSGYPDGLRGEAIPLGARIVSIVDAYDAMDEARAYHQRRPHDEIMAILEQESGSRRDPDILETFRQMVEAT